MIRSQIQSASAFMSRVLASPLVRTAGSHLLSALALLLGLWLCLGALAFLASQASNGIAGLVISLGILTVLFWINRLHSRWESGMARQRRQYRHIARSMRAGHAYADACHDWSVEESRRDLAIRNTPRWKRLAKRVLRIATVTLVAYILFIVILTANG